MYPSTSSLIPPTFLFDSCPQAASIPRRSTVVLSPSSLFSGEPRRPRFLPLLPVSSPCPSASIYAHDPLCCAGKRRRRARRSTPASVRIFSSLHRAQHQAAVSSSFLAPVRASTSPPPARGVTEASGAPQGSAAATPSPASCKVHILYLFSAKHFMPTD